jgi:predicted ATPase
VPASWFIGRDEQMEGLAELLNRPDVHLITITGPGGIGKTRLAQEVARRRADKYRHGVYFIPLEAAATAGEMIGRMSTALAIQRNSSIPPEEAILSFLRDKQALLVFDTLEHLLTEVELIGRIRRSAPKVQILATSRSVLRLSGERVFVVPPLAGPGPTTDPATIAQSDAVALFEARVREIRPEFALSSANAVDVAEICRLLGGLPLALELAAAQTRTLSLGELRLQLSRGAEWLAGGPRDAPARHRSIHDTLAWSYDLMSPAEQALFRCLGVFSEGCTLAAAEAVAPEKARERGQFIDVLSSLIDHSLLQVQKVNERRIYRMHEITLRYARDGLIAAGELDVTMSRLLDFILGLAQRMNEQFRTAERARWLELFGPEDAHVWVTLEWGLASGDAAVVEKCLALTGCMLQYWNLLGQHDLAWQWTDRALNVAGQLGIAKSAQGAALITASSMALIQANIVASLTYAESALDAAREAGDMRMGIRARHLMGLCAFARGELDTASEIWEKSLALAEELGEGSILAVTLDDLGNLASRRREYEKALSLHLREQAVSLAAGDLYSEFYAVINLGEVSMLMERPADAELYNRRALELCRQMGDSRGLAHTLITQATLLLQLGRPREAWNLLREAITLSWRIHNLDIVLKALELFATSSQDFLSLEMRTRLVGVVAKLSELYSSASLPTDKASLIELGDQLRQQMNENIFAMEWRIGQSLSWEQAVELALGAEPEQQDIRRTLSDKPQQI